MQESYFSPGQQFGRLIAVSSCGPYTKCRCVCGTERLFRNDRLKSGKTKSCGCLRTDLREAQKKPKAPAIMRPQRSVAERKLAAVHSAMMQRCYNPRNAAFVHYGGRGIEVCLRWHDCGTFIADMSPTYKAGKWLERVDNDLGYSPENCAFATPFQQSKNRRNTIFFPHGVTLAEWCRHHGVEYARAYRAYYRMQNAHGRPPTADEMRRKLCPSPQLSSLACLQQA
jgi:hypothetical protein